LWPPNVLGPDLPVRIRYRDVWATPNLLSATDSSFEDGTVGGWDGGSGNPAFAATEAVALDGSYSLQISATGSAGYSSILNKYLPVVAGLAYRVSLPILAGSTSRTGIVLGNFYDAAHGLIGGNGFQSVGVPTATDHWTELTVESVTAPAGAAFLILSMFINGSVPGEIHYIDQVSVARAAPAWHPVFDGLTDAWEYDAASATVTVPLVDRTAWLANQKLPAVDPVGAGETVPARISRILTAAAWAGPTDIAPSQSAISCIPTTLEGAPWDQVGVAADTDLGIAWIDRGGAVAFRPMAQAGQSWTPEATGITLTDGSAPGVCVLDYSRSNPEVVRNIVSIAHALAPPDSGSSTAQVARSDGSVQRYGPKSYERSDLICDSDSWCALIADSILEGDAFPWSHPEGADLDIRVDPVVAWLLLAAELASIIDVVVSGVLHPCVIVGYHVVVTRRALTGSLILSDVTKYEAGGWDSAGWDIDAWGV
jgi:hypothetical protein